MFPQLIFTYQIILKNLTEVINQDHDFLKKVTQPKQVKEQLAQIGEDIYINNSVHKIMEGGTSVHEKKRPENKATTHQSYDQKTVADQVTQPKQVKEQSAQLNRELEKTGKAIKPLLDTNLTAQNGEESAGDRKRKNEDEKDSVSKKAKLDDEDDDGIVCLDDDIVEVEEGQSPAKKAKLAAATGGATVAKPVTKEDSELVCID